MLAIPVTEAARSAMVLATQSGSGSGSTVGTPVDPWVWAVFVGFIAVLLLVDLKVVMRESHEIGTKEAGIYSAVWIALGVVFTGVIWVWMGPGAAGEYITGYLIEKSLSIDNVFVWAVLFTFFAVPAAYQHRVLFWGIFGALVLRAAFIFAGVALLQALDWIIYVFGAFLLFTAYRIATSDDVEVHPDRNPVLRRVRQVIPQTKNYREDHFFVVEDGRRLATPMVTVLISVELTDVLFAVDSIPAILAITQNQFLVFSSNAFAILGLRALYFLLADMQHRFVYLNKGLGVILGYVGVKFLASEFYHIPTGISLGFIAVVLTVTIWLSLRTSARQAREAEASHNPGDQEGEQPRSGSTEGREEA
ncbi:MAG: TerC family protein [Actinomycetota bacterium]|nr:TerC family protein [Actinomycetota bacterium]